MKLYGLQVINNYKFSIRSDKRIYEISNLRKFLNFSFSDTKYWQEKTATVARKFAGKGLHFVMADEGKQSADMAAMKLTDLGVVSQFIFVVIHTYMYNILMLNSVWIMYWYL